MRRRTRYGATQTRRGLPVHARRKRRHTGACRRGDPAAGQAAAVRSAGASPIRFLAGRLGRARSVGGGGHMGDRRLRRAVFEAAMSPAFDSSAPSRGGGYLVVRSIPRIAIVPLSSTVRLAADDNYVRLTADREYRRKGTLAALIANLGPGPFLRVHRSHAVNLHAVRELKPLRHGEFAIALADGTRLRSSRS